MFDLAMTIPEPAEADPRWSAVVARDAAADGRFVYAVRTTGVFCRPSCPSRRAKRENVGFFADAAAARGAGFRACKRCRPESDSSVHAAAVVASCRMIEAALEDERPAPSLDELAARAGYSPFHLHRLFKAATGVTPKGWAAQARARRAAGGLAAGVSVTAAIHGAGYSSSSRFYDGATARLGMAPKTARAGGAGETVRFAVGDTSLGAILVAATDKGVCAIQFGDDPQALIDALAARFPAAALVGDDSGFARTVATVVAHVERPDRPLDLPLDVRGTAFQERVWRALTAIPRGATASYAEVARAIGAPASVRAVAGACAANPAALAIPCHRVVRADGGLSGYRWGVERKTELLRREGARR